MATKYSDEQKQEAKRLFLDGATIPEIAEKIDIPRRTLYDWQKKEEWGEKVDMNSTEWEAHLRLQWLLKHPREDKQYFDQVDLMMRVIERFQKIRLNQQVAMAKVEQGQSRAKIEGKKTRGPGKPNDCSELTEEQILAAMKDGLFDYQLDMWDHRDERRRNILKSRQIGFTFYFSREAICDGLLSGRNKIFISASRAQADIFREYIRAFMMKAFDIDLKGRDKIEINGPNGMFNLYFLSTNSDTGQGRSGDLYVDEYFWIPKFKRLKALVQGMASQIDRRATYFSTPSTKSHEAYGFWSGADFKENCKKTNQPIPAWPSEKELHKGVRCPDGVYRRIITVETAIAEGCDKFSIDMLKLEYSEDEFRQLFLCVFIDDTAGIFKFSELEKCLSPREKWKDLDWDEDQESFKFYDEVWLSYDPSRTRDDACIVIIAPPKRARGKFRVIDKVTLKDATWDDQAAYIKKLCAQYHVTYIVIDRTGPGSGVYEAVKKFRKDAVGLHYSLELKNEMVMKAQKIIRSGRIAWDPAWSDIAMGFLQIKRITTSSGNITYAAQRSAETGHADSAFAIMQALIKERLTDDSTERLKGGGYALAVAS